MAARSIQVESSDAARDEEHYREGRPPYPRSISEIIYKYRCKNSKAGWERLIDVGAGSGIATTIFMPDFKAIHILNPIPAKIEQARSSLSEWARCHKIDVTLEYHEAIAEEMHTKVSEQADLVICATTPHFIDPDVLVPSMARMLRPEGTLAVFTYWMPIFPGCSQHLHDAFSRVWDNLVVATLAKTQDPNIDVSQTRLARIIERRISGKGMLDYLPLPDEFFTDPQRVYINANSGEIPYRQIFQKFEPADQSSDKLSRVEAKDHIVHYTTGIDTEAEGWMFKVDKRWLPSFVDTIHPSREKMSEVETQEAYAEWDAAFEHECPDGILHVLWPAYLVLATRR